MFCSKCGSYVCECDQKKVEPYFYNPLKPISLTPKHICPIGPVISTFKLPEVKINTYNPIFDKPKMLTPRPMFRPMEMPQPQWNMMPTLPGFLKC